jgi:hypothetical protein
LTFLKIVVDRIFAPNLTNRIVIYDPENEVSEMFDGFSAPKLKSLQFYQTPCCRSSPRITFLQCFPNLNIDCFDEPAFISLLELQKPLSLQEPEKHHPLPELKELTMSTPVMNDPISLKATVPLKAAMQWPKIADQDTPCFIQYLTRLLRKRGIELILSKCQEWSTSGKPPEFQDEFVDKPCTTLNCKTSNHLFTLQVLLSRV